MQRVTITIEDDLLTAVDALMQQRGYGSRSEAVRDIIRERVAREQLEQPDARCVGVLSYVFDHATRELAARLTRAQHDQHDLSIASLHVHLDHDSCLEVAVLRGAHHAVRGLADSLVSQRGVRHAQLHVIPAQIDRATHRHGGSADTHDHVVIA